MAVALNVTSNTYLQLDMLPLQLEDTPTRRSFKHEARVGKPGITKVDLGKPTKLHPSASSPPSAS